MTERLNERRIHLSGLKSGKSDGWNTGTSYVIAVFLVEVLKPRKLLLQEYIPLKNMTLVIRNSVYVHVGRLWKQEDLKLFK